MSKLTLTFDTEIPEERKEALRAINAIDVYLAISDFFQQTRKVWKYGEDKEAIMAAEVWERTLRDCLEERGVDIDRELD